MTIPPKSDKQQIGLTAEANDALKSIALKYFGDSQKEAYLFCIAYAIAHDLDIADAPQGGYTTKFNGLGTLDPSGSVRDLLEILRIGEAARPLATMERLAEVGVADIFRRLAGSETMADVIGSTSGLEPEAVT